MDRSLGRKPHQYDVFINHRGPDVKKTFVAHLNASLRRDGFRPFLDAKDISQGRHVFKSIDKALTGACVHVAVFSKRYAESKYCLNELCDMLRSGQVILPVFYGVNAEDLRRIESGPFNKGFEKHVKRGRTEEIGKWKEALRKVADHRGFRLDEVNGDEEQLIRSILVEVRSALPATLLAGKQRYGMEGRLKEALNSLDRVNVLGVVGMGGIGKTTLAMEIYDHFVSHRQFERHCFLRDVRSRSSSEPSQLRRDFMHAMGLGDCDVMNTGEYGRVFEGSIPGRVLVVVDDIDDKGQFKALVPDIRKLGSGSRIVITSRYRDVVTQTMAGAQRWEVYEVPVLNEYESRCLFNRHAFLSETPSEGFADMAEKVADACGGHALSLETVGASLFDKKGREDMEIWSEAVKDLKENEGVFGKLRSTYERLPTDGDRAMFLDIACMLIGMEKEVALTIWKSCSGCSGAQCSTSRTPYFSLRRLMDRSLVRVDSQGMLRMHDVLRDMGRDMVKRDSVKKERRRPEKWTHLWDAGVAAKVLSSAETKPRIRGLCLGVGDGAKILGDGESAGVGGGCVSYLASRLSGMKELHLLVLDGSYVEVRDENSSWPEELRWLRWRRFRGGQLPSELKLLSLVVLDLGGSRELTCLWEDDADIKLPVLQLLTFSWCTRLVELPENFGQSVPKLKRLEMRSCGSVKRLPESIGLLTDLEHLDLYDCVRLVSLPDAVVGLGKLKTLILVGCESLQQLPEEMGRLTSLETLDLLDCICLSDLPASINGLKMLTTLEASHTAVLDLGAGLGLLTSLTYLSTSGLRSCVPGTFQGLQALTSLFLTNASADMGELGVLTALKKLNLSWHKTITALPKSFGNLKWLVRLDMSQCQELLTVEALPEGLERLELRGCLKLTEIPSLAGMKSLVHLDLPYCGSLRHVRGLECLTMLEYVDLSRCTSIDGRGIRIMGCRALRECRVGGSKIGVAYDNRWMEGGPMTAGCKSIPISRANGPRQRVLAGPRGFWSPMVAPTPPPSSCGTLSQARSRHFFSAWRETISTLYCVVNARMATLEAGRGKKGKHFSADEERCLCRSFLAVSQDPVCGNGQRNTAFWERITTHFNKTKPRYAPTRPSRSLESKWSHIKHDVAKFVGAHKQVSDSRESGVSAEDVLERALEYYKDRHPKQQTFAFLHCWQLLKEVPRWWQSAMDVQKKNVGPDSSAATMARGRGAAAQAVDLGEDAAGSTDGQEVPQVVAEEEVQVVSPRSFRSRPARPQGNKAAKNDQAEQGRKEAILKSTARATEQMAAANLRKAEAMADHAAAALFRMPMEDLDEDAKEYFQLRRKEELERIKRRMDQERRVAEREKMEHDKLQAERAAEKAARERAGEAQAGKRQRLQPTTPATATASTQPPPSPAATEPASQPHASPATDAPTHSPTFSTEQGLEDDSQRDDWEDSQCIPNTQFMMTPPSHAQAFEESRQIHFAQPSPMYPLGSSFPLDSHHPSIGDNQMYGFRNFGQGLNLNARFYSQ
ncbi:hypothetical protein KC19_2G228700 [Ceratodon purpureus]|uniref:TIR domain-containing protein n=1 Tax=Ceratodon purpureus TaxID=3225 RepID=A0A8T0IX00_CERPU|nr:hypothetical protein KC19_2G228700 [Ceratodon purpureus]